MNSDFGIVRLTDHSAVKSEFEFSIFIADDDFEYDSSCAVFASHAYFAPLPSSLIFAVTVTPVNSESSYCSLLISEIERASSLMTGAIVSTVTV